MTVYTITAVGPEMDETIVRNWRQQWVANGRPSGAWSCDQMDRMMAYVAEARAVLQHQSFVAISSSGEVVGSGACQLWRGVMPHATREQVGTCWGVFVQPEWRRRGVATQIMRAVVDHWRTIGCQRGVLLCASDEARRIYERLGFGAGNMMLHDLKPQNTVLANVTDGLTVEVEAAGPDADAEIMKHWREVWLQAGFSESELAPDLKASTNAFIKRAREKLEYKAFVARNSTGVVVGSASSQVWEGPGSNNHTWQRLIKIGVVWGLYVHPKYRGCGVEAKLLEFVVARWKEIGCTKGFTFAASNDDAAVHRRLGFDPQNAMVIELGRAKSPLSPIDLGRAEVKRASPPAMELTLSSGDTVLTLMDAAFVTSVREAGTELGEQMSDSELALLRLALPQMVNSALPSSQAGAELKAAVAVAQAAVGVHIDGSWYTRNIVKFGGGFDMKQLTAQPGKLAPKFDRLSTKYDQWTVGNRCTYYDWLARMSSSAGQLLDADSTAVDVACGIGLPGHMLRLCGFKGRMDGTDISPGMLERAHERQVYNYLFVANANEGLAIATSSVDLVICVGAMELLDHSKALAQFARILKPGGRMWVTFQWEKANDEEGHALLHPTAHQNVSGVTVQQLMAELKTAGFDTQGAVVERASCAFFTPSPKQDGSVLPVPYLYVSAGVARVA